MKELKKAMRILALGILILLAASGIGITGTFLPVNRDEFQNNETKTEQLDKKKEEDEEDETKKT